MWEDIKKNKIIKKKKEEEETRTLNGAENRYRDMVSLKFQVKGRGGERYFTIFALRSPKPFRLIENHIEGKLLVGLKRVGETFVLRRYRSLCRCCLRWLRLLLLQIN